MEFCRLLKRKLADGSLTSAGITAGPDDPAMQEKSFGEDDREKVSADPSDIPENWIAVSQESLADKPDDTQGE